MLAPFGWMLMYFFVSLFLFFLVVCVYFFLNFELFLDDLSILNDKKSFCNIWSLYNFV